MSKKNEIFQKEKEKLQKLFDNVADNQKELVEGLVDDAAFLFAENHELKEVLSEVGMIRVNPKDVRQQKTVPAAAQFLKNVNSYANVIKTLNSILNKNVVVDDDDLSDYE